MVGQDVQYINRARSHCIGVCVCVLHVPVELGLSWDSTLRMKCTGDFLKDSYSERNMRFGIREFGMGAVSNALSLDKTGGAWQSLDEL